jgi:hypothetical protein
MIGLFCFVLAILVSPFKSKKRLGFAERVIGSIRRECLDHVVIRGEAHLCRVLKSYADYYNGSERIDL